METKTALRIRMRERLRGLGADERAAKNRVLLERFWRLPEYHEARAIGFYVSTPEEADTRELIRTALQAGKAVAVPRVSDKELLFFKIRDLGELRPGRYGIEEPEPLTQNAVDPLTLDLVVVPGLAFDDRNRRLGRGGGYYDRLLARFGGPTPRTVGLGYDFQRVREVPAEAHDRLLDAVLTD